MINKLNPENLLKIRRIDHVVLRVKNIEAALDFYVKRLGLPIEREISDLGLVQLRAGDSLIDLVPIESPLGRKLGSGPEQNPEKGGRNMDHFALSLATFEEAALRDHLQSCGIKVGETSERYGAEGFGPSIYISDPDGNTVELKGPATTPLGTGY